MFTASVVVGRPFKTHEGQLPPEMCPPQGYDAVLGEVNSQDESLVDSSSGPSRVPVAIVVPVKSLGVVDGIPQQWPYAE